MNTNMNYVSISGKITAPPVELTSKAGKSFTKVTIDVTESGDRDETVLELVGFGSTSDFFTTLKPGDQVNVSGKVSKRVREYNGKTYSNIEIFVKGATKAIAK